LEKKKKNFTDKNDNNNKLINYNIQLKVAKYYAVKCQNNFNIIHYSCVE